MRHAHIATLAGIVLLAPPGCAGDRGGTRTDSTGTSADTSPPAGTATAVDTPAAVAATSPTDGATVAATDTTGVVRVAMRDAEGRDLGTLALAESAAGLVVSGTLRGLAPGAHAIHVHTTGRCDAPSFESAGGHWNPTGRAHGAENPRGSHFGDLPNLTVGADGRVTVQATTPGGTLTGADALRDADGAALVVHAAPDDYRTDPSGAAGARIACGVVGGA